MADVPNSLGSPQSLRSSALSFETRPDARLTAMPMQAVLGPTRSADERAEACVAKGRARFVPQFTLLVSDVVALAGCLFAASYIIHHSAIGPAHSIRYANLVLGLPLFVVVVASFSLNNLYAKSTSQVLKNLFNELHAIVYSLGIAGFAVLCVEHFLDPVRATRYDWRDDDCCGVATFGSGYPLWASCQPPGVARCGTLSNSG